MRLSFIPCQPTFYISMNQSYVSLPDTDHHQHILYISMNQPYSQLRDSQQHSQHSYPHRTLLIRACFLFIPFLLIVILVAIILHLAFIVNISDYNYPRRSSHPHTAVILATNDIHGYAKGFHIRDSKLKQEFTQGGLPYLMQMIKRLKDDWKDSLVWVDAGDQYQGGIENSQLVSNGSIMMRIYNTMGLAFSSIGNHEFDNGPQFLDNYMKQAKFSYLAANIYKSNTSDERGFLPNTKVSSMLELGNGLKLGLIGLTTIETVYTTSWFKNTSNPLYDFRAYAQIVVNESAALRSMGANAVILIAHVGNQCGDKLNSSHLWNATTSPRLEQCPSGEMLELLSSLPEGTVQAVVAGHIHETLNHYFNQTIPVVQNVNGGREFHLIYLNFDEKGKLIGSEIEGPVPVCSQVYKDLKYCPYRDQNEHSEPIREFKFHQNKVVKDSKTEAIINDYENLMQPYYEPLANSDIMLEINDSTENDLGDLVCDCIRNATNSDFTVLNPHGFRAPITPGSINFADLYSVFPFQNEVEKFTINGKELRQMMTTLQMGKKGLYQTSGLSMTLTQANLLQQIQFYNHSSIEDHTVIEGVSIDFLLQGGDDFKDVINKSYTPREVQAKGHLRDMIKECFTRMKVIKRVVDPLNPRMQFV